MAKSLRRRSTRIGVASLAGLALSFAAAHVAAQEDREGVKVELDLTGGYHHFANDLELGVADDPALPSPKPSAAFGLRVGLVLHPLFVIEAEGLLMPTKDNQQGNSVLLSAERLQLRFNIAPNAVPGLTPFILAGFGGTSVLSSSGGGGYAAIKSGDTDANFYGGIGAKYALSNLFHVRLDGRAIAAPNTKNNGFSADWEVLASVGVTLGGHAPPPPMAPVAALVKDTDRDGIPDEQDKCPNEAGPKENGGCPDKDSDGDGIVDRKDKCPDKAGPPEREGCPEEDADKDGIVDSKDKCPNDAEDKDGFEDEDGCPDLDNDKDGVPDAEDKCPNEPETKNGYQDEDGCPDEVPGAHQEVHGRHQGHQLPAELGGHQGVVVPAAEGGREGVQGVPGAAHRDLGPHLERGAARVQHEAVAQAGRGREGLPGLRRHRRKAHRDDWLRPRQAHRRQQHARRPREEPPHRVPAALPEGDHPEPGGARGHQPDARPQAPEGEGGPAADAKPAPAKKAAGKKKGASDDEPMPK